MWRGEWASPKCPSVCSESVPAPIDSIDLWLVDLDRCARSDLDPATLTAEDRVQSDRMKDADAARRLLSRRSTTRSVLASYLETDAAALLIGRTCPTCGETDHGRPFVMGTAMQFSVSSSGRLAVVAVSDRSVGVDIEAMRTSIVPLASALSETEQRGLASLGVDQQGANFLRLWTAKEAVLKAGGRSLADDPAGVDVAGLLTTGRATVVDGPHLWKVRHPAIEQPFGSEAVVAVADERGVRVVMRSVGDRPPPVVA